MNPRGSPSQPLPSRCAPLPPILFSLLFLFSLFLLAACSREPPAAVGNASLVVTSDGSSGAEGVVLAKNNSSRPTTPVEERGSGTGVRAREQPGGSGVGGGGEPLVPVPLEERLALAEELARRLESLWRAEEWGGVARLAGCDEEETALWLRLQSPRVRVEHDPAYAWVTNKFSFTNTGTQLSTTTSLLGGEAAIIMANVTFNGVLLGEQRFNLSWEGSDWRLAIPCARGPGACENLSYADYCYYEYATAFGDEELCAKSGALVTSCYRSLGRVVPASAAFTACSRPPLLSAREECLLEAALDSRDEALCEAMQLPTTRYECLGALLPDPRECASFPTSAYQAFCVLGYARATNETSACALIPHSQGSLREECYELS